jgi:hypothetical protein
MILVFFLHSHFKMPKRKCPICYERLGWEQTTLRCKHSFHTRCLFLWTSQKIKQSQDGSCPLCRQVYTNQNMYQPDRMYDDAEQGDDERSDDDETEQMQGTSEEVDELLEVSINWSNLTLYDPIRAIRYMRTLPMQRWNTPVWLFGPMFICILDGMMLMGMLYLFWLILLSPIVYIFSLGFLLSILLFRCYIISANILDELDKLWETPLVQWLVSVHVCECMTLFMHTVYKEYIKLH